MLLLFFIFLYMISTTWRLMTVFMMLIDHSFIHSFIHSRDRKVKRINIYCGWGQWLKNGRRPVFCTVHKNIWFLPKTFKNVIVFDEFFRTLKREKPDLHKVCGEWQVVCSCKIDLGFKIQLNFLIFDHQDKGRIQKVKTTQRLICGAFTLLLAVQ